MQNIKINTPESHLVTVFTVSDSIKAELIKNMLADHGIQAELGGEHQGGFTGALSVEIIVRQSDANSAREFIATHFPDA